MGKKNEVVAVVENSTPAKPKMTFEEYQAKYSGKHDLKRAKSFLTIFIAGIGIGIAALLTLVVLRVFEINQYVGYGAIALAVLLFIFCYIVPVVKVSKLKAFMTDVDNRNGAKAKRHNRQLRGEIADKMIEVSAKADVNWYKQESIGKLAVARQTEDNEEVKSILTSMYKGEVNKKANGIIASMATQIGIMTALSQSDKIDTLVVALFELNLIKKIVYLYGFRPSEPRLMRIYGQVLTNALIAYGASSLTSNLAIGIVNSIGGAMEKIPVLGSVVSTAIGSTAQGVINSALSVVIGFQTKAYLMKEYHLQDILDGVEIPEEPEEEAEVMSQSRKEVVKAMKDAKTKAKVPNPAV